MKYTIDAEFNGFGGELITFAIVREDGQYRYFRFDIQEEYVDWVRDNVIPYIDSAPLSEPNPVSKEYAIREIAYFLSPDLTPTIIADWPDDIRYFCEMLIVGPGRMVAINNLTFEIRRVISYPTNLKGAVQHNALWDARAFMEKITNG